MAVSRSVFRLAIIMVLSFGSHGIVHAQPSRSVESSPAGTSPPDDLAIDPTTPLESIQSKPEQEWYAYLAEQGLQEGDNPGDIIVSSGSAPVIVSPGRAGWIEARWNAFNIAQLRAKANIVRAISEKIGGDINFAMRDEFRALQGLSDVKALTRAQRILEKSARITEKMLDNALEALDPEYDPSEYENEQAKKQYFRRAIDERIRRVASRMVAGMMTLAVFEGPGRKKGSWELVVGVIWTPRTAQIAYDILNPRASSTKGTSGRYAEMRLADVLPKTVGEAAGSFGTQFAVDSRGFRGVLAYGQAEVRRSRGIAAELQARAAIRAAETRARALLAAVAGEIVTLRDELEGRELAALYSDLALPGVGISRRTLENIRSRIKDVEIRGIKKVMTRIFPHPVSGQEIALVAVYWSPSTYEASRRIESSLERGRQDPESLREDRRDSEETRDLPVFRRKGVPLEIYR